MDRRKVFTIGQVAELSHTPITTLRYYESVGLIDPPARESGQRRYSQDVLMRLMVIRFCKVAGLTIDEIGVVLGDRSVGRVDTKAVARGRIALIDAHIEQLQLARRMMAAATRCECADLLDCSCGSLAPVIADLRRALERQTVDQSRRS